MLNWSFPPVEKEVLHGLSTIVDWTATVFSALLEHIVTVQVLAATAFNAEALEFTGLKQARVVIKDP